MLLEQSLALGNKKTMKQFELIKVMNDRLSPCQSLKHRRIVAA